VIYLDSSAVVKLCHVEPETAALTGWLNAQSRETVRISSALARIEVARALLRVDPRALANLPLVLAGMATIAIDEPVVAAAAAFTEPLLRSLDAIHLASALRLGPELTSFVTYDKRLATISAGFGLPVLAPD
jgi:predicted nucleic acid-binding protein